MVSSSKTGQAGLVIRGPILEGALLACTCRCAGKGAEELWNIPYTMLACRLVQLVTFHMYGQKVANLYDKYLWSHIPLLTHPCCLL